MPKFLFKASYTPEGVKGVVAKGGSARRDAISQLLEAHGGSLELLYFAFGDTDVYAIGDLPDDETATAIALAINADGRTTVETVVLITPETVDAAAEKSVEYRAPGT
jgi:uncharacterized protein with GYD domain